MQSLRETSSTVVLPAGISAKVNMIFMDSDDNTETTAIRTITEDKPQMMLEEWYTINGQRLNQRPASKGIYIHNGREEVIQ